MRILWTLPYLPWPTTSGGKTRQYHLLRCLAARGHRITLLVQTKDQLDDTTRATLEPLLERLIVLPRRPLRHPLTVLGGLCAPWPLMASINGLAPSLQTTFAALLQEPWDAVQIEHSYSFQPFAEPLAQAALPFLLTEHNLESDLGAATYSRFPRWSLPFTRFDQWRARRWERQVLGRASLVVAVTEEDGARMAPLTTRPPQVVVNGVDCQAFASVQADPRSQRVLFVGNYEYAPNRDAVAWALNSIFPRLWRRCPHARFAVAGYALPADWPTRWPDPRIEWLGFVPTLSELQGRCAVFLAPLRHGGGSKLKVLEALAGGLPLVSTAQGVSGLRLRNGHEYRAADTAQQLAAALELLLSQHPTAHRLGEAGRAYVRQHHDWPTAAAQLEQVYQRLAPPERRVMPCA